MTKKFSYLICYCLQLPPPFYPLRIINVYFNARRTELNIRSNELNSLQTSVQLLNTNSFYVSIVIADFQVSQFVSANFLAHLQAVRSGMDLTTSEADEEKPSGFPQTSLKYF